MSRRDIVARALAVAALGGAGLESGCDDGGDGVPEHALRLGRVSDLPVDRYVERHLPLRGGDGRMHRVPFYVRATPPAGPGGKPGVVALSSLCTHQGCPTRYVVVSRSFICPCHGGVFGFDGAPRGGPPKRALDRGNTVIRDGVAYLVPLRS